MHPTPHSANGHLDLSKCNSCLLGDMPLHLYYIPPDSYTLHLHLHLHPIPYTLHLRPIAYTFYTVHTPHYTLHPIPYTLHPTSYTLHPTPYTLSPHISVHPTPYRRAQPLLRTTNSLRFFPTQTLRAGVECYLVIYRWAQPLLPLVLVGTAVSVGRRVTLVAYLIPINNIYFSMWTRWGLV